MAQWPMSLWALLGTGLTFAMTAAGSAMVFFFRNEMKGKVQSCFLGFAGGIMMAASVWSLLIPSIEETIMRGQIGWIPAAGGFFFGGGFLYALETGVLKYRKKKNKTHEVSMLLFAVTLHNIPEGMAVGIAFAMAGITENSSMAMASAIALAIGIGIQNFPEGAAVSIPLRQRGLSRWNAFFRGSASGIVEPIAGFATALFVGSIAPVMPWLLAFAAGAMVYVVIGELIPEALEKGDSKIGTIGFMAVFLLMMIFDVAL